MIGRDLQILHLTTASPIGGCYPDGRKESAKDGTVQADDHLRNVACTNGLVTLLSYSGEGRFTADEVNRVVMRLFVPGYEQAKPYFQDAVDMEVIPLRGPYGYFDEGELKTIIANISKMQAAKNGG